MVWVCDMDLLSCKHLDGRVCVRATPASFLPRGAILSIMFVPLMLPDHITSSQVVISVPSLRASLFLVCVNFNIKIWFVMDG